MIVQWRSVLVLPAYNRPSWIVWTVLEEREREFCNVFGVEKVIPKWAGMRESYLGTLTSTPSESSWTREQIRLRERPDGDFAFRVMCQ